MRTACLLKANGGAVLGFGLGLAQTGDSIALFPLAALLEYGYAFKTLENASPAFDVINI